MMDFMKSAYKKYNNDQNHSCDINSPGFNRYGDLCGGCKDANSTVIDHGNAKTSIFLDQGIAATQRIS